MRNDLFFQFRILCSSDLWLPDRHNKQESHSTSKICATVVLPEPDTAGKSDFNMSQFNEKITLPGAEAFRGLSIIFYQRPLPWLIDILCPFNGNSTFFNFHITARTGFQHDRTIFIHFINGSMNTCNGNDFITLLHILLEGL